MACCNSTPQSTTPNAFIACNLPNLGSQLRRAPHGRTSLNVKRIVKLLQVYMRTNGAELAGTVRIDRHQSTCFSFADIGPPDLCEGDEKTLFGCEAIDVLSLRWVLR